MQLLTCEEGAGRVRRARQGAGGEAWAAGSVAAAPALPPTPAPAHGFGGVVCGLVVGGRLRRRRCERGVEGGWQSAGWQGQAGRGGQGAPSPRRHAAAHTAQPRLAAPFHPDCSPGPSSHEHTHRPPARLPARPRCSHGRRQAGQARRPPPRPGGRHGVALEQWRPGEGGRWFGGGRCRRAVASGSGCGGPTAGGGQRPAAARVPPFAAPIRPTPISPHP